MIQDLENFSNGHLSIMNFMSTFKEATTVARCIFAVIYSK